MDVKITAFAKALQGLAELTALDLHALANTLDARIIDGLENGKAQQFENTMELCWKAIKVTLREREGIDEASPKKVIKAWYLTGHVSGDDYVGLIQAVDDSNKLSHVYDQQQFNTIIARLPNYAALLTRLLATLAQ
ncbi:MAG: nucleotidyltransferase substrate binding protein [Chromatiaceae bacterium]